MKTKRSLVLFSALFIAIFCLFSCSPKEEKTGNDQKVKHYRHILFNETEYDQINGSYPITEEEAKTINNYKFTYNDEGKLASVEFVRGDELLGYSAMGVAKIAIEYVDNTEIRYFFDKDGQAVDNGGAFKYVFTYDENGVKNGLKFYDKDGNQVENRNKIAYFKWEVLSDGMVKENRYNLAGEETVLNEFCPFYELRFSYDERGFVKRMANYMEDSLYNCTVENCGDVGVSYFLFKISDKGDLEEFSVHNSVGQYSNLYWGYARIVSKYDEFGNAVESVYYDQDNEFLGGKTIPVRQYKYDEHGSVVEVSYMDKDHNLTNHPSAGFAVVKYEYLDNGQPSDTLKFDNNMQPIAGEA